MLKKSPLIPALIATTVMLTGCYAQTNAPAPGPSDSAPATSLSGPAPAWHLKDLDGNPVSSDQFKGKVVVLDFWATWCPPCREEIPGYVELQKKYGKDGLVIVGAAVQEPDPEVVKKFVKKYGVSYQIVMADDAVQQAYGSFEGIPTTFLIDRNGVIRDEKMGAVPTAEYEQRILSVLKN